MKTKSANAKKSLGDRMKEYERVPRHLLTRRVPVIIRVDGKAFHTFTRGMRKPFDKILMDTMQNTMKFLCENIQGCVFGYSQSDGITLVLTDYATVSTDAWFGYNVQKMTSVAASMATQRFNNFFSNEVASQIQEFSEVKSPKEDYEYLLMLSDKNYTAMFDARVFSIPKEEVCNCLIWRQQDATRNSIEAVGQANFSHRELCGKSCKDIQEMLWSQRNINWNDFPVDCKRGSCCYRVTNDVPMKNPHRPDKEIVVSRRVWVVDRTPPIFTQDRLYVERWL